MTTRKQYREMYNKARDLSKDASTPIYQYFDSEYKSGIVIYSDDYPTPAEVYSETRTHSKAHGDYYYIKYTKTDIHGNTLPKGVYRTQLMHHRKYARRSVEVVDVTFDIIGLKRASTNLPAGVIIGNIQYIE